MSFRKKFAFRIFALMSSYFFMAKFDGCIALFIFLASKVTRNDPSCFGVTAMFEIHGARSLVGCFSMTSLLIISFVNYSVLSCR